MIMGSGREVSKKYIFNMADKLQWTGVRSSNTPLFFKR
jgi:hypothetical protein